MSAIATAPFAERASRPAGAPAANIGASWKALNEEVPDEAFLTHWLAIQCQLIGMAAAGSVQIDLGGPSSAAIATAWPNDSRHIVLRPLLEAAREGGRGVVDTGSQGSGFSGARIAYPVMSGSDAIGAVAILLEPGEEAVLAAAMRQLQWGVAWLRERLLQHRLTRLQLPSENRRVVLDALATALETRGLEATARAVATDLARAFDCERVSIGMSHRGHVRLAAISHSAHFGRQMSLTQLLCEAMEESLDQRSAVLFPPPADDFLVCRAHRQLAESHAAGTTLTLPMLSHDGFVGAITLERRPDRPFAAGEIAVLDMVSGALAPVFEERFENDRWLIRKAGDSIWREIERLFGPHYAARKLIALAGLALAFVFFLWTDTYRVTADATIEGRVQRAIAASFNGFVRDAPRRAGDVVREGDVVATLDDRDLVLERLKWSTERQRRVFEQERALGDRNRAEQRIATSQIQQADAQIKLVDEQLARTRLTAPFDGVIVSGDLTQSIGASVQRGQVLFELAPTESYRIALAIDETQIADVKVGQTGRLVVAALPSEEHPFEIMRLTPVAKAQEGRNMFRVEAALAQASPGLKPGMRGAAKIEIDRRRVAWIWTRSLNDWLRLGIWRWFG
jgi:RND family efflux transporter MFP subunit